MLEAMAAKLFGSLLQGQGLNINDPLVQAGLKWSGKIVEHGLPRWRAVIQSGIRCTALGCGHPAVGACVVCHIPACLDHSLVSSHAEQICVRCVHEAIQARGTQPPRQAPGPQGPTPEQLYKEHLKTLGLKPGATSDEVRDAFRRLALKHHPDRQPPAKREAAQTKFKKISVSYHWLLEYLSKAAAA